MSQFLDNVCDQKVPPDDLEVQVAIATDIAVTSPATFPAIAAILSYLIAMAPDEKKRKLWQKVRTKMSRVPHNGHLEIWLQRVVVPSKGGLEFESEEPICKVVQRQESEIWNNAWIASSDVRDALSVEQILVGAVEDSDEVVGPDEVQLFRRNAWAY